MTATVAPPAATPPRRRPSRWWIAATPAALVFAAAAIAAFVVHLDRKPETQAAATSPPSPGVFAGEHAMTSNELLTAIADRLAATPADTRTGTYELIHNIIWGTEIQGPIHAVDQQTWRLPDGTARYAIQASRTLPAKGFDPMTASLDFTTATLLVQDNTVDPQLVDSPDITLSAAGDPVAQLDWYLATQRHGQPASTSVHIQELVSLYHYQIVATPMRAAILRLLAQLPDTTFTHLRTTDPLHRDGIAFHTSAGDSDTTLIIDPVSGTLNAVEERFHGRLWAYTLFYPSQWADQRGPTHPKPTPISTIPPSPTTAAPAS